MAHSLHGEVISVHVSERIPCVAKRNNCECCKILKAKLCEMQTELSSCREIIQILQEEIQDISSIHQPIENSRNNEPRNPAISEKWTTFSSTKGKCRYIKACTSYCASRCWFTI
jgi:hypothetical protein